MLNKELDVTVLLVEQKLRFVRKVADTFYIIDRGRNQATGNIDDLNEDLVKEYLTVWTRLLIWMQSIKIMRIELEEYENTVMVGGPKSLVASELRASVAKDPILSGSLSNLKFRSVL